MNNEEKFKSMTDKLMMISSSEDVEQYIRWIIKSDAAKEYWVNLIKNELKKQYLPVIYENGYPVKAVAQATIESLEAFINHRIK